jgi:hypothetical protein
MAMQKHTGEGHCLPGLTARQSQTIRNLIRTALAERGLEAVVYADHVETAGGRTWGLHTLGSLCHTAPSGVSAWRAIVNRYVDDLLTRFPDVPLPLTHDQIRAGVHLRLAQLDPQMADGFTYARNLGGGFYEVLAHKEGDYIRWINDQELAGLDVAEMRDLGMRRLRDVVVDECQLLTGKGAEAYSIHGESGFIASKLLMLPDLMRRYGGRRMSWTDGALVTVPSRHRLTFAPLDDAVADNLSAIAAVAAYDYTHDHAPISPVVHWWKDDRLHPLFDPSRPGISISDDIPDEFWEAWRRNDLGSGFGEDVA